jgi:hypothetical protein
MTHRRESAPLNNYVNPGVAAGWDNFLAWSNPRKGTYMQFKGTTKDQQKFHPSTLFAPCLTLKTLEGKNHTNCKSSRTNQQTIV